MGQHHSIQNQPKNDQDKQSTQTENVSTLSLGRKSTTECSSLGERSTATVLQFKRKLKRIELYSLHQVFDELKTEYPDHFECIEAKKFLVKEKTFCALFVHALDIKRLGTFKLPSPSRTRRHLAL